MTRTKPTNHFGCQRLAQTNRQPAIQTSSFACSSIKQTSGGKKRLIQTNSQQLLNLTPNRLHLFGVEQNCRTIALDKEMRRSLSSASLLTFSRLRGNLCSVKKKKKEEKTHHLQQNSMQFLIATTNISFAFALCLHA